MHLNLSASKPNCRRLLLNNGQTKLILRGGYDPSFVEELKAGGVDILVLSTGQWESLQWVADSKVVLPRLEIISPCDSYQGLNEIMGLVELSLDDKLHDVDLDMLKNLKVLDIYWSKAIKGKISKLLKLQSVKISYYGEASLLEFGMLPDLERLEVCRGSLVSLQGINDCMKLQELHLTYLRNLDDLSSIEKLANLSSLHIEKCPNLSDIGTIQRLINLEHIRIECGCEGITGVEFFAQMSRLKKLLLGIQVNQVEWGKLLSMACLEEVVMYVPVSELPKEQDICLLAQSLGREVGDFQINGTKKKPWVWFKLSQIA